VTDTRSAGLRAIGARTAPQHALLLGVLACLAPACAARRPPVHSELEAAAQLNDALAVSDALEALIAKSEDTPADREYAYRVVHEHPEDTAAYTFARAAVTGRLLQQKGLLGASMVRDVERSARRSRELDPGFRDSAATRLLGTLYVIAPASLLKHGDSEAGVELLEGLAEEHPDVLENHLRLAEAYIALGDPAPAFPHLCRCLSEQAKLRLDDQQLLLHLVADAAPPPCPTTTSPQPRYDTGSSVTKPPTHRGARGTKSTAPPAAP